MREISFTTTSCCRNELLYITYDSFVRNFQGINFKKSTLFLNLDCYDGVGSIVESIKVSKYFFGNVVYNISNEPNFAKAIKWCWGHDFDTPYVFNLEEDWELLSEIDVDDIIFILEEEKFLVSVRLRHRGRYVEGKSERIVLLPSLFKKDFLKISNFIREGKNPERSIKLPSRGSRLKINKELGLEKTYSYLFTGKRLKQGDRANSIIRDIGREWKNEKGYSLKTRGIKWRIKK